MRKTVFLTIAVASGISFSSNALELNELDLSFNPRLETGAMFYEFEQSGRVFTPDSEFQGGRLTDAGNSKVEFSDILPFIGGGLTVFANRFFVDFSVQYADNGEDIDRTLQTESIFFEEFQSSVDRINRIKNDVDFDRLDLAVSVGYGLSDHIAFFAGYKRGETDFTNKRSNQRVSTECGILEEPAPPGCASEPTNVLDTEELEFESDGPFVGFNFLTDTLSMGFFKGVLSGNIAVAFLDATTESTQTNIVIDGVPQPDLPTLELDGDTIGLSAGVTWRGATPIDGLTYSVGINGYQYDFSGDEVAPGEPGRDFEETLVNFKLGLAYSFGI